MKLLALKELKFGKLFLLSISIAATFAVIFSFIPSVVWAAPYDCSSDANCVASYNFESGALTTDSEGTNTLTSNGSPTLDTLNYRQGSGSVGLSRTSGDWYSVADASLQADFPGKVVSDMSSCFWVRPEEASPSGNRYIMSKFAASPSPFIVQYTTAQKIKVFIGASTSTLEHATALTIDQWYHVCFSYNSADDSGRIHIYDDTGAATLGADATGTFSSSMTTDATDNFVIGSNSAGAVNNRFEGNIDEMLIFKDVLSTGEMDAIRAGATPNPDVVVISSPVQYQAFQRTTDTTGPIAISGQYAGSPTAIECSFNGGTYATVDAAPSSGTWSGTLTATVGDGTLSCRFTNDTGVSQTTSDVRMGDVYMVIGQSNTHGRATSDQSYAGSNHGASQFDTSDNWEALGDGDDFLSALYGSTWPLLGTLLNDNENVPIAFLGYASGGTGFTGNDWNQGDAAYNTAVAQFNDSGVNDIKAFLWYQGENDASLGMSAAAYETALSTMLNNLQTDLSTSAPLVATLIGEHDTASAANIDAVRTGIINAWTNDADIYSGPSAHDQDFADDLHWTTNAEIQILADRWYRALSSHFYSGAESARGPLYSSAERIGLQLVDVTFSGGEGSLNDETDTEGWVIKDDGTPVAIDSVTLLDSNTIQIDTSANLTGVVTVDYLSGPRAADAAWRDSGTYPLPPEPILNQTVSTPPLVSTLSPLDNATGVTTTSNLVITFAENVDTETGASNDIIIKKTSDDSTIETIDAKDAKVTGTGTTTITINPDATLDEQTEYYVQIGADAFDDAAGYSYAGISDTTSWSFTIGDFTDPTASTLSPLDNATSVGVFDSLVITFAESIVIGTGNITIKKTAGDTVFETIDVTSSQVTGDGTTEVTINPSSSLPYMTGYYVQIDATAFDDASSNSFAGIADTTTWSFTTVNKGHVTTTSSSELISSLTHSIEITSPNGSEDLIAGEDSKIAWDTGGTGLSQMSFVDIFYSIDGGYSYIDIVTKIKNAESYDWKVPEVDSSDVLVMVAGTDLADILAFDVSDSVFSISLSSDVKVDEVDHVTDESSLVIVEGISPVTGEVEQIDAVAAGDYIRGIYFNTVYYVDSEMRRRPFVNNQTFFTWQDSFDSVVVVTDATLASLDLGVPMLPKAQVVMMKIQSDPKVYVIEGDNILRWVQGETVAQELYGEDWSDYIIDVEPTFFARFKMGEGVSSAQDYIFDFAQSKRREDLH